MNVSIPQFELFGALKQFHESRVRGDHNAIAESLTESAVMNLSLNGKTVSFQSGLEVFSHINTYTPYKDAEFGKRFSLSFDTKEGTGKIQSEFFIPKENGARVKHEETCDLYFVLRESGEIKINQIDSAIKTVILDPVD